MSGLKRTIGGSVALVVVGVLLAACGSSSSSSSSTSAASSSSAGASPSASSSPVAAGACGTIPTQMPADPDGVLAKLPASIRANYDLMTGSVYASAYANWKPTHKPPYTIYFSPGNTSTPYIQSMMAELNQLQAQSKGEISKVIVQDSNNSLQTQIQQIQEAVRSHVDIMIVLPLSPSGNLPEDVAAGKAGIPVIEPLNSALSPYVIGFAGNIEYQGAKMVQSLVQILHEKGNVLDVQGIPGVLANDGVFAGASLVLKKCPNIKTVGSVVGQFVPTVAKAQVLEFLASHPQPVDAAIQTGGMATGIMQAFVQTGRTVPAIADQGATPGALAYWNQHKSTYDMVANAIPPAQSAQAAWTLASGLLQRRGMKISDIEQAPVLVTSSNLAQWVEPSWTLQTPIAYAPGPPNALYPASYLEQFFAKPPS